MIWYKPLTHQHRQILWVGNNNCYYPVTNRAELDVLKTDSKILKNQQKAVQSISVKNKQNAGNLTKM